MWVKKSVTNALNSAYCFPLCPWYLRGPQCGVHGYCTPTNALSGACHVFSEIGGARLGFAQQGFSLAIWDLIGNADFLKCRLPTLHEDLRGMTEVKLLQSFYDWPYRFQLPCCGSHFVAVPTMLRQDSRGICRLKMIGASCFYLIYGLLFLYCSTLLPVLEVISFLKKIPHSSPPQKMFLPLLIMLSSVFLTV